MNKFLLYITLLILQISTSGLAEEVNFEFNNENSKIFLLQDSEDNSLMTFDIVELKIVNNSLEVVKNVFPIINEKSFAEVHPLPYLQLDNIQYASFDEAADDPLLVLRTKLSGASNTHNFESSRKKYEKINFESFEVPLDNFEKQDCSGFDMNAKETLNFEKNSVKHVINTTHRIVHSELIYASPLPIIEIKNEGNSTFRLRDYNVNLNPGSSFEFAIPVYSLVLDSVKTDETISITSSLGHKGFSELQAGKNVLFLDTSDRIENISVLIEYKQFPVLDITPKVINTPSVFNFIHPYIQIDCPKVDAQKIWWQISSNEDFSSIIPNFESITDYNALISFDELSNTFFNNSEYYFRFKVLSEGSWSHWSVPFEFEVLKSESIEECDFQKIANNQYRISWESDPNKNYTYHVFGSNAKDFIPSLYNENEKPQDLACNLIISTKQDSIIVDGSLSYYRIIAESNGSYSVPSPLIYLYDWDELNVSTTPSIPIGVLSPRYLKSPYVDDVLWNQLSPHFLPENHPIKANLDRIFSKGRVTLNKSALKKAGFKNFKSASSKVLVAWHSSLKGYVVKIFTDDQTKIEWVNFKKRIDGAAVTQQVINNQNWGKFFKTPKKWIYPLPAEPSPPANAHRKNFILVAQDVNALKKSSNYSTWKSDKISHSLLDKVFTLLHLAGLADSCYAFNMPFCKDGKIAIVDTEDFNRYPVRYHHMLQFLSKSNKVYWQTLIKNNGPTN